MLNVHATEAILRAIIVLGGGSKKTTACNGLARLSTQDPRLGLSEWSNPRRYEKTQGSERYVSIEFRRENCIAQSLER